MAYTTIDKPTDYFNTVLFSGNETARSITGVGFQPDWVWIKDRSQAYNHHLFDVIRGATKRLKSDTSDAESTNAQTLTSFDSDGFSLGTDNATNGNGSNVVSWNWLAGGTASSNTDGSITSTVSANTTAGFSIVKFIGNETSGDTVGHGLGSVPGMIIIKKISSGSLQDWVVNHKGLANQTQAHLTLNTTNASANNSTLFDNTAPTSSVFSVGANSATNASGATYISYCFAEKKGFSKFGSYTGNGNADGTFVYTGFKPAWVMFKGNNTSNWQLWDNKRDTFNPVEKALHPDASAVASTDQDIDFLSNGFKIRGSVAHINGSGVAFYYMAFAESPFVTSTGIPTTAR